MQTYEQKKLVQNRRKIANLIFEHANLGAGIVVEDSDGWKHLDAFGNEMEDPTWVKFVLFSDKQNPSSSDYTSHADFSVTFHINTCKPVFVEFDGQELEIPKLPVKTKAEKEKEEKAKSQYISKSILALVKQQRQELKKVVQKYKKHHLTEGDTERLETIIEAQAAAIEEFWSHTF